MRRLDGRRSEHQQPIVRAGQRSHWPILVVLVALLVGCSGNDTGRSLSDDDIRTIVREEAGSVEAGQVREIAREEIARALAEQERSEDGACDIGTAATRALPSVVQIETFVPGTVVRTGSGSGFVALAGGIIVTAAHVVKDSTRVDVVTTDGRRLVADVIKRDEALDLAVLRTSDRTLPPIAWADPNAIALGEPVRIIGYPGATGLTVTGGVLASRMPSPPAPRELLITDANADLGNSGGPLVTACGEALGVVVERRPFVSTVSTVSVGASTTLPFVLTATGTASTPTGSTGAPTPTRTP
jgi:S1-C subfamily serine protease